MPEPAKPEMNPAQETVLAAINAGNPPVFPPDPTAPEGMVRLHHESLMKTLHGHSATILRVVFSHGGQLIATSSYDQSVKVWHAHVRAPKGQVAGQPVPYDQEDDKCIWTFKLKAIHPNLAFFPDDKHLVTSARDGHMKTWDLVTGQCVNTSQVFPIFIKDVDEKTIPNIHTQSFSKDCGMMMTLQGSHLKRWDTRTGKCRGYFKEVKELRMRNMAISRDGNFCVISGERKTPGIMPPSPLGSVTPYVGIWDLRGQMSLERIEVDPDGMFLAKKAVAIKCIDISETGTWFALGTGSPRDSTASVWDVQSASRLVTLQHSGTVWSLKFAHHSHWLITGGSDKHDRVRIWDWKRGHCLGHLSAGTGGAMCLAMHTNKRDNTRILAVGHQHGVVRMWDMARLSKGVFRQRLGLVYMRELMGRGRAELERVREPRLLEFMEADPQLAILRNPRLAKRMSKAAARKAEAAARAKAQEAHKLALVRKLKYEEARQVAGSLDFATAGCPEPVFKLIVSFVDKVTTLTD